LEALIVYFPETIYGLGVTLVPFLETSLSLGVVKLGLSSYVCDGWSQILFWLIFTFKLQIVEDLPCLVLKFLILKIGLNFSVHNLNMGNRGILTSYRALSP
jgi:hypothetical protein